MPIGGRVGTRLVSAPRIIGGFHEGRPFRSLRHAGCGRGGRL